MARTIDQIRASKLPSNMMQFAARGALQVSAAENIEILVYLAVHNKVFGELARMTLAGWDEKACLAAASDPKTPTEVLDYFISPDNLRPRLLPGLLENPSLPDKRLVKLAASAMRDTIEVLLKSKRALAVRGVIEALKGNPYIKKGEVESQVEPAAPPQVSSPPPATPAARSETQARPRSEPDKPAPVAAESEPASAEDDAAVAVYLKEHEKDIAAEGEKPFQSIGGIIELLGPDYFPVVETGEAAEISPPAPTPDPAAVVAAAQPAPGKHPANAGAPPKRENTLQKINSLDVKGRIQLALKGNKEERSILIRDGTKVVALAVLEAPKLSDGEVEKFASQKNVLEAVLRQIPLKRRFVKNYIVVRNLVGNPRTPLDLGLGLMKNLLVQDLKNLSANKEVSETIRKLALKMFKQKIEEANKK
jgi:hypothetical protein